MIHCLCGSGEVHHMLELYHQTWLLQTGNKAHFFQPLSSCFLVHSMLLLWENSRSNSNSLSSFSSMSSFCTYSFSSRCIYKEEENITAAAIPKIDLLNNHSNNKSKNANRNCWKCLTAKLQCRELLLPWALKNSNSGARRATRRLLKEDLNFSD